MADHHPIGRIVFGSDSDGGRMTYLTSGGGNTVEVIERKRYDEMKARAETAEAELATLRAQLTGTLPADVVPLDTHKRSIEALQATLDETTARLGQHQVDALGMLRQILDLKAERDTHKLNEHLAMKYAADLRRVLANAPEPLEAEQDTPAMTRCIDCCEVVWGHYNPETDGPFPHGDDCWWETSRALLTEGTGGEG